MPNTTTPAQQPQPEEEFVCSCMKGYRSACYGGYHAEHEGKPYCFMHYPGEKPRERMQEIIAEKHGKGDGNYRGVWFPDNTSFSGMVLEYGDGGMSVDFSGATFGDEVLFSRARFGDRADFSGATFGDRANFYEATFGDGASFFGATFGDSAKFGGVGFGDKFTFGNDASFREARFGNDASFKKAKFGNQALFYRAEFRENTKFNVAEFGNKAVFSESSFGNNAFFIEAKFGVAIASDIAADDTESQPDGNHPSIISTLVSSIQSDRTDEHATSFINATFHGLASFAKSTFRNCADFRGIKSWGGVYCNRAQFISGAQFNEATFHSAIIFLSVGEEGADKREPFPSKGWLNFSFSLNFHPEHIQFHSVTLRPAWFINSNPTKFDFIDVTWEIDDPLTRKQYQALSPEQQSTYRLLAITAHHLAVNANENRRYSEASRFRYLAAEIERVARPVKQPNGKANAARNNARVKEHAQALLKRGERATERALRWGYWLLSGYSERVGRALLWLVLVVGLFAVGYCFVQFQPVRTAGNLPAGQVEQSAQHAPLQRLEQGPLLRPGVLPKGNEPGYGVPEEQGGYQRLSFGEALQFSMGTMLFQRQELRPVHWWQQLIVYLQIILGPVQATLLALAIRRKFQRHG